MVRELLSMELNYINVRHPDFNGVHMERVRVEATAKVRKVWNEGVMREWWGSDEGEWEIGIEWTQE